jgi:hypothetical protein
MSTSKTPQFDYFTSDKIPHAHLSVGEVIKESWISTLAMPQMTWAVFVLHLPVTIFISSLPNDLELNYALAIFTFYNLLISGFVFFGIYRAVFVYKNNNVCTSFGHIFVEGLPYWWRNIKLTILTGFYVFALTLCVAILPVVTLLASEQFAAKYTLLFYLLAGVFLMIGLFFAVRVIASISICFPRLADSRKSASEAISYSSKATKLNIPCIIGLLGMCFVYHLFFNLISFSVYVVASTFSEHETSKQVEIILDLLLSLPFAFVNVLTSTSFALLYLRLRK